MGFMYSKKNRFKRMDIASQLQREFGGNKLVGMPYELRQALIQTRAEELCREAREQGYTLSTADAGHPHDFCAALNVIGDAWL